jgi:hypothetical protein
LANLVITAILTRWMAINIELELQLDLLPVRKRRLWDSDCKAEAILLAASSTPTLCINAALTNVLTLTTGTGIGTATRLPGVTAFDCTISEWTNSFGEFISVFNYWVDVVQYLLQVQSRLVQLLPLIQ